MALESRDAIPTQDSSISRMARGFARVAAGVVVLLGLTAALSAQGGDKAKVAESVKADLTRLVDLERTYWEKNHNFTTDLRALGFAPTSGANVTMSYASARSWAATATHPTLTPTSCFVVMSQPGAPTAGDRAVPFCSETSDNKQVAAAPATKAPASKPAVTSPKPAAKAPQTVSHAEPRQQQVVVNRRPRRAAPTAPAPVYAGELPARAPAGAIALANTRAAGGAADAAVTEAVTPAQFTERLNAFVASALDMTNAKMPELARDPYESTAEYQARVAQAFAVFQRREAEFYAKNTRTFVVSIPVKDAKYDPDRELVEFSVDAIALPTARTFAATDGARLSVACYSRPVFWCSPESGMQYDGSDLWHVTRATARTADVLHSPMTLVARFVVGRRDDARSPAVSLVSMELQAKGAAISRWEANAR
jgi:hypothetical protein